MTQRTIGRTVLTPAVALAIALCLLLAAQNAMAQSAGSLTAVNGTVTVTRGTAPPFAGAYGAALQVGDRIVTGPSSSATITLTDGTQMELTDSASLTIDQNLLTSTGTRQSTRVSLLDGVVRSLVRFTPGTPPNFEVHTPNAVAAARGTSYDTQYQKGVTNDKYPGCLEFTHVDVYEGVVEVSNPTNPSSPPVQVKSGQKVIVPCGLAPAMGSAAGISTTTIVVGGVIAGAAAGVGAAAGAGAFSGGGGAATQQR
ncbi:MAG: FecR family protein [Candidatus Binataceae bacterium]